MIDLWVIILINCFFEEDTLVPSLGYRFLLQPMNAGTWSISSKKFRVH